MSGSRALELVIYELVAKGEAPPHMRVGQTLRFPEDGVVQFIREQSTNKESV